MNAQDLIERQRTLAGQVITTDQLPKTLTTVAGVDVAFPNGGRTTRAAAVLMRFPDLVLIEEAVVEQPTTLPYIPGLLSFRELPAILGALAQLPRPDLVLCDGQGLAHPRRFGVACHLGVETGLPAIGVGKSRLCGQHEKPGLTRGACSPLMDGEERIGTVLRTRQGVRPVYVSIGYKICLEQACDVVLACAPRFRLPEPIRRADRLAGAR